MRSIFPSGTHSKFFRGWCCHKSNEEKIVQVTGPFAALPRQAVIRGSCAFQPFRFRIWFTFSHKKPLWSVHFAGSAGLWELKVLSSSIDHPEWEKERWFFSFFKLTKTSSNSCLEMRRPTGKARQQLTRKSRCKKEAYNSTALAQRWRRMQIYRWSELGGQGYSPWQAIHGM